MAIDITTPPGAPPRDLLLEAVTATFDQIFDAAARSDQPPQLQPAIDLARHAQERDDVDELVRRLRDVAHAAITSIVRVRAAAEEGTGP